MTRTTRTLLLALCAAAVAGCGPRVEYRVRPGFATKEDLPDEIVLEDGTIIRYIDLQEHLARQQAESGRRETKPRDGAAGAPGGLVTWEEAEDGSVTMRAERNDQLVMVVMRAFREERYGELWDQLVAKGVRDRAAREGTPPPGPDAAKARFIEWCERARPEVMTLLNRMSFAFSMNAVVIDRAGPRLVRLRLAPQIKGDFKYRTVEVFTEPTADGDRVFLGGIR